MASEKTQNLQDVFLNHVRKQKVPVTVFLVNGVKLQGIITPISLYDEDENTAAERQDA